MSFGSFQPLGMPGGGKKPQIVIGEQKKSLTRRAMGAGGKAVVRRHQNRTEQDRDKSRERRARIGDNAPEIAAFLVVAFAVLLVGPWWLAVAFGVAAVIICRKVEPIAAPLRRRRMRREAFREWSGDSRESGVAHGLGLVSAGRIPALVSFEWEEGTNDRQMSFDLVPGITVEDFEKCRPEMGSAFGAGFVEVKRDGRGVLVTLRAADPLTTTNRVQWSAPDEVPATHVNDVDGREVLAQEAPWWMVAQQEQEKNDDAS